MARTKNKKSQESVDGKSVFIRDLPLTVIKKIKDRATVRRQNLAGVIIELVEHAEKTELF